MKIKLTLTIEKEVIKVAKEFAEDNNQTLSEMVENYLIDSLQRKERGSSPLNYHPGYKG